MVFTTNSKEELRLPFSLVKSVSNKSASCFETRLSLENLNPRTNPPLPFFMLKTSMSQKSQQASVKPVFNIKKLKTFSMTGSLRSSIVSQPSKDNNLLKNQAKVIKGSRKLVFTKSDPYLRKKAVSSSLESGQKPTNQVAQKKVVQSGKSTSSKKTDNYYMLL